MKNIDSQGVKEHPLPYLPRFRDVPNIWPLSTTHPGQGDLIVEFVEKMDEIDRRFEDDKLKEVILRSLRNDKK